jgi:HlyD family secretion protein
MTKKRRSGALTTVLVAAVAGGAAWALGAFSGEDSSQLDTIRGARVARGSLRISVVERGNLEAADSVTLKSEIEGQTTVLWLIEEGTEVEEGELLVELDTADLLDRRVQQEIQVQNSEATLIKAQQNHAIQLSQNESDIANAEREREFAGIDLEKYIKGDLPQELQKKDEDILLADEELTRARQDYSWSEKLHEKGFLEQAQLDADRLAETRSTVKLKQAERAKALFIDYEIPRTTKELEAGVEEKIRERDRVKLQAKARVADFVANVRTAQAKFDLEKSELEKILSQIDKARIVAPVSGMVVYAIDGRSRWGDGEPMQEGAQVRERQDIITIPKSDGFVAEASLHESVLEKVDTGMTCAITIDALRGDSFSGEVTYKALLPDQQSRWMNPDLRVYRTTVQLLEADPRMRPGMSCSLEILVDELLDVTYVPVQAVFLDGGETICLVTTGPSHPEKRSVNVGQSNGKWVEIQSGVSEGETVLLAVPPGVELKPATEKEMGDRDPGGPPADRGGESDGKRRGDQGGERPKGKPGDGRVGGHKERSGGETKTVKADVADKPVTPPEAADSGDSPPATQGGND